MALRGDDDFRFGVPVASKPTFAKPTLHAFRVDGWKPTGRSLVAAPPHLSRSHGTLYGVSPNRPPLRRPPSLGPPPRSTLSPTPIDAPPVAERLTLLVGPATSFPHFRSAAHFGRPR